MCVELWDAWWDGNNVVKCKMKNHIRAINYMNNECVPLYITRHLPFINFADRTNDEHKIRFKINAGEWDGFILTLPKEFKVFEWRCGVSASLWCKVISARIVGRRFAPHLVIITQVFFLRVVCIHIISSWQHGRGYIWRGSDAFAC